VAFAEDESDFFDPDEFADEAIYTPPSGPMHSCLVIVDEGMQGMGDGPIIGTETHISLMDRSFNPEPGGIFTVGVLEYEVHQLLDDDGGIRRYLVQRK
jgi:hypothetical protein